MLPANLGFVRRPAGRVSDAAFVAAALAAIALTGSMAVGARTWIGRPFPGFFMMADRTVPAIGRGVWNEAMGGRLYDRTVVAIDDVAIARSDDLHRRIASKPVGSAFAVTLADHGGIDTVTVASRPFSIADYWAVFGAYLFTGLLYVLLAILAAWLLPANRLGRALMMVGGAGGLFMLSAADLYPPGGALRVHALSTALLPAALVQFALVVGNARAVFARLAAPAVWAAAIAAALSTQVLIGDPAATRAVVATCNASLGLALAAATVALGGARMRLGSEAAPLVSAAIIFGLGVPAVIFLLAAVSNGVPVNASATLAFLFPLGIGAELLRDRSRVGALAVARSAGSL
jgi:hypothetical protein